MSKADEREHIMRKSERPSGYVSNWEKVRPVSPKERLRRVQKVARRRGDAVIVAWCDLALHAASALDRQEAIGELARLGAFDEDPKSTDR